MIKACFSSVTYASKTALPKLVTLDQKLSAVNDSTPIWNKNYFFFFKDLISKDFQISNKIKYPNLFSIKWENHTSHINVSYSKTVTLVDYN